MAFIHRSRSTVKGVTTCATTTQQSEHRLEFFDSKIKLFMKLLIMLENIGLVARNNL